jgi:hypothetical protein
MNGLAKPAIIKILAAIGDLARRVDRYLGLGVLKSWSIK